MTTIRRIKNHCAGGFASSRGLADGSITSHMRACIRYDARKPRGLFRFSRISRVVRLTEVRRTSPKLGSVKNKVLYTPAGHVRNSARGTRLWCGHFAQSRYSVWKLGSIKLESFGRMIEVIVSSCLA